MEFLSSEKQQKNLSEFAMTLLGKKRVLSIDCARCHLAFIAKQMAQKSHVCGWQHGGCTWRIGRIPPMKYLQMSL